MLCLAHKAYWQGLRRAVDYGHKANRFHKQRKGGEGGEGGEPWHQRPHLQL